MDYLIEIVKQINNVLLNYILLVLLCGTGIFFTFKLQFIQVRKFGEGFRRIFGGLNLKGKKADKDGMSSFQALSTAIAAQVGTGNLAGAATAIVSGGPGAIFWMWLQYMQRQHYHNYLKQGLVVKLLEDLHITLKMV